MVKDGITYCPSGIFSPLSPRQHIVANNNYRSIHEIRDER
jgi:hypothetical protein